MQYLKVLKDQNTHGRSAQRWVGRGVGKRLARLFLISIFVIHIT